MRRHPADWSSQVTSWYVLLGSWPGPALAARTRTERRLGVKVRIRLHSTMFVLAAAAAAIGIATAPGASATPGEQLCSQAVRSTTCQRPGNQQVYTSLRALARVLPPSINPRWRDSGYSARFPTYGFDPKWQAFGYNPLYSGFQPR